MGTLAFEARTYRDGSVNIDYSNSSSVRKAGGDGSHDFVMEIRVKLPVAVTDFTINLAISENNADYDFRWAFQTAQNEKYYHCGYSDSTLAAVTHDGSIAIKGKTSQTIKVSRELDAGTYYIYLYSSKNQGFYEVTSFSVSGSSVTYTEAPGLPGFVNVNGTYREIADGFANVNGKWYELVDLYGNNAGKWVDMGTVSNVVVVNTTTQSIAIGDTRRYCSVAVDKNWPLVSSMGLGSINYVGQGTDDYNSMMIPIPAFSFTGKSVGLKMQIYIYVSSESNHTFRWAITNSRANESRYEGYGAVTDANQLASGTFTPEYKGETYSTQTFDLACTSIPSGKPIYLYLWRDNTKYGNIHVKSAITVTLEYSN